MDNIYIIAIVGLLLVAGLLFFLMQRRKGEDSPFPTSKPISRQEDNIDNTIFDSNAANATNLTEHDESMTMVNTAQGYMDEKRYDEAEKELKRILGTNPIHPHALLMLLNTYAATNNRETFSKLYAHIQAKADMVTLQQAKNIKAVLDSSANTTPLNTAAASPVQPPKPSPEETFSLDDDISFDDTSPTPEPAPVATSIEDDTLSFDSIDDSELSFGDDMVANDIDSQSLPKNNSTSVSPPTVDSDDTDNIFDLSGDFEFDTEEPIASNDQDLTAAQSLETPTTSSPTSIPPSTPKSQSAPVEDSFDFSFDDVDFGEDSTEETLSDEAATDSDINTGLDTNFDIEEDSILAEDTPVSASKVEPPTPSAEIEDDFSFNFDDDLGDSSDVKPTSAIEQSTTTPSTVSAADAAPSESAIEDSFDEFSFDFDDSFDEPASSASSDTVPDKIGAVEDKEVKATVELVSKDIAANELNFDDSSVISDTPSELNLEEFDFNSDPSEDNDFLDNSSTLDIKPTVENFANSDTLDDDIDLFASIETEAPTVDTTTTSVDELDSFDFDDIFDLDLDEKEAVSKSTINPPEAITLAANTTSREIELGWDEPLEETTTVIQPAADLPIEDLGNLDGLESTEPQSVFSSGFEDTLSQLDAMSYDDMPVSDKAADVVSTDSIPSSDEPIIQTETAPVTTPKAPEVITQVPLDSDSLKKPIVEKKTESDSEFSKAFGFIETLDKSQITLDLAEQYLELGEYDSAKRLVNEVLDSVDGTEQQSKAKALLERMN